MGLNIKELEKTALAIDPKDPLYSHICLSIKVIDVINLLSVVKTAKEHIYQMAYQKDGLCDTELDLAMALETLEEDV